MRNYFVEGDVKERLLELRIGVDFVEEMVRVLFQAVFECLLDLRDYFQQGRFCT